MQSSSRSRIFNPTLAGASPATDAMLLSRCNEFPARRSAKAEVRGASPRESASFQAPVPQQLQGGFRKPVFVGASPTRGSISNQDRGVTAALRVVNATVRVQLPAS